MTSVLELGLVTDWGQESWLFFATLPALPEIEQDPPEYATAAMEMLDSRWAKQTPNRAEAISAEMAGIG